MIIKTLDKKDGLIERTPLKNLLNKTFDEIVMSGHMIETVENGFNSYGHLFLKSQINDENAFVFRISCDRLDIFHDVIILEIDICKYDESIVYEPIIKYKIDIPFTVNEIIIYGQKGSFHFKGKEIHPLWFKDQITPDIVDYEVDSENAIMLISTDGRRIFIAHDTAPRFEVATSEAHIKHILSHKYGFEGSFFQIKRVISR